MWDSSPSFNEFLLCAFVRFALFVTKQEIFEKGASNCFFFKKYVISGRNCSNHQQCDRKDVGKICFENKSNLKQYLVDNLAQK